MLTPQDSWAEHEERRGDDPGETDSDPEHDHLPSEGEHDTAGGLCGDGREQRRRQTDEAGIEGGEPETVL